MSTILSLIQGSPEWHEHRARFRNASETSAVMGLSPWLTPYMVWELKTGRRVQEVNYAMKRGTEMEPIARAAYEKETGTVMEPVVMVEGEYSASLDGISFAGDLVLEVKCPLQGRESETWKTAETNQVPLHYYWQVQHQLMVSGAELAHFYVFDGEVGLLVEVKPNYEDIAKLRQAWDEFMVFVESNSPPPLSAADTVTRDDAEWQMAAKNYVSAKQAAEEAAKAIDNAKTKLTDLAKHSSERGHGVSVSKYWKGGNAGKQEVRVTVCKGV